MQNRPHAIRCGAKTRSGEPCKNYAMENGRCRMHGGKSTGPKDKTKLKENKNAEKHGFFSKYLPKETMDLVNDMENLNTIDILWDNIKVQYAAIIRSQKIMYVKDEEDHDIHVIKSRSLEMGGIQNDNSNNPAIVNSELQIITAGERQANFLQSQSRAMATLTRMIKDYEELCKSDMATEEQKLRIEKLKAETEKMANDNKDKEPPTINIIDRWADDE